MLLEVKGLKTHFFTEEGVVRAVDGVDYSIERGKVLGIVGESGSGKSVSSLSTMGLIPTPPGRIVDGQIRFTDGDAKTVDLVKLDEDAMRQIRGNRIAMIFQDPMTSLNPYLKVSAQLAEVLEIHVDLPRSESRKKALAMLKAVGIPDAERRFDDYPHQLSGGMRQRVMIAMALLCDPVLLIADEPTTALDVTIQAQILDLIDTLRREKNAAVVLITHDLGVVAKMADHVAVMYAGRIVEQGPTEAIFDDPRHPYTVGLARSIPHLTGDRNDRLVPIPGMPPTLSKLPPGCPFEPRCPNALSVCKERYPETRTITPASSAGGAHVVACHELDRHKVQAPRPIAATSGEAPAAVVGAET